MKVKVIFLLMAFGAVFTSCKKESLTGNGSVQTQERDVHGFSKVATQGSTKVHIIQGAGFEVKVKAYANLLPHLKTKVEDGILSIRYEGTLNVRNDNSEVFITMPVLTGLSSQGSGDISATGEFNNNATFNVQLSGSADVSVEKGSADNFILHTSGSGGFGGFGFSAKNADIFIEGSGNAEISLVQQLKAKIRGSGNVYYKGNPATIDDDISGSGKIIKR